MPSTSDANKKATTRGCKGASLLGESSADHNLHVPGAPIPPGGTFCRECGKSFEPKRATAKFCGAVCRHRADAAKWTAARRAAQVTVTAACCVCGETFALHRRGQLTCSRQCSKEHGNRRERERYHIDRARLGGVSEIRACAICGAPIGKGKKSLCSEACRVASSREKRLARQMRRAQPAKPVVEIEAETCGDEISRDWTGYLDRCVRMEIAPPWVRHPQPIDPRDIAPKTNTACAVRAQVLRGDRDSGSSEKPRMASARCGHATARVNGRLAPGDDVSRRRAPSSHTAAGHSAGQTRTDQFMHDSPSPSGPTVGSASRRPAAFSSEPLAFQLPKERRWQSVVDGQRNRTPAAQLQSVSATT